MAGSNGTRMAGEELSKKDRHYEARLRKSKDPEDSKRRADRARNNQEFDFGDKLDGYSDYDISMALRGQEFSDEDYFRLTGEKWEGGGGSDGGGGGDDGGGGGDDDNNTTLPADPVVGTNPVEPSVPDQKIFPILGPNPGGGGVQNINQDNDIVSNVTGDGNNVTNNQDNSINQFGSSGSWKNAWMKDYFS